MPRDNEKISVYIDVISQAEKRFKDIEKSFSDTTKQLSAGVQQINRNFAGIHHSLNNLHSAFSDLSKTNEKLVSSLSKTASTNKNVKESVSGVTSTVKGQHFAWRGLVWTIVRAEIVYRGIMRILRATKDAFVALTENIDQYRNSMIRIAALQTTAFQPFVRNANELKEVFNALYESSQKTYQSIETLSIRTPLTAQQLMRVYQAFLAYGQNVDLTNRKVREGLLGMANAIYLLTGGLNLSRQLFQEVRSLVTGRRIGGDVYNFLISQNEQLKESIKLWVRQGTLVEHLSDILRAFVIAGNKSLNTIRGLTTTLKTKFAREARQAFSGAYNSLVAFLKILVKSKSTANAFTASIRALSWTFRQLLVMVQAVSEAFDVLYTTFLKFPYVLSKELGNAFVKILHGANIKQTIFVAVDNIVKASIERIGTSYREYLRDVKNILNPPEIAQIAGSEFFGDLLKAITPVQSTLRAFQAQYQEAVDKSSSATIKSIQRFLDLRNTVFLVNTAFKQTLKNLSKTADDLSKLSFIKSNIRAGVLVDMLKTTLNQGDVKTSLALLKSLYNYLMKLGSPDAKRVARMVLLISNAMRKMSNNVAEAKSKFRDFEDTLSSKINNELSPVFDRWQRQLYNINKGLHFSFGEDEVSRQLDSITNRFQNAKLQLTQLLTTEQQKARALRNYLKQDDLPDQVRATIQKNLSLVDSFIMQTIHKLHNLKQAEEQVKQAYLDWYFTTQEKKIKLDIIGLQEGNIAQQLVNLKQNYEQQRQLFEKYHKDTTDLTLRYKLQQKQIVDSVEEQITDKVATEEERRILEARKWRDAEIQNLNVLRRQGLITIQEYKNYLHMISEGYTNLLRSYKATGDYMVQVATQVAKAIQDAFATFFFDFMEGKLKSLSDYVVSFTKAIEQIIAQALAHLMVRFAIVKLFGAETAAMLGFARGGAFENGVQVFAEGGILTKPTLFPMANGLGLAGEAGPEAIMPLARNSKGELGVKAQVETKERSEPKQIHLNIVNTVDPQLMGDYLSSPSGANTVLNVIQANSYKIRKILNI